MIFAQIGLTIFFFGAVNALEVGIPERFLRPRNFNPHPYALEEGRQYLEETIPQDVSSLPHPYQFFERPPTRGEPSSGAPIQFPKVPESAQVQPPEPTARLKPSNIKHPLTVSTLNEVPQDLTLQNAILNGGNPQYRTPVRVAYIQQVAPSPRPVPNRHQSLEFDYEDDISGPPTLFQSKALAPKNYAFAYAVNRDHGDDFSHSQAHQGAQTKGEYRVKLPDGRVQVVSYTADDNGYKADVRYDHEENAVEQEYQSPPLPYKPVYKSLLKPLYKPSYKSVYQLQPSVKAFTPIYEKTTEEPPVSPSQIFPGDSAAIQYTKSTAAPVELKYSVATPRTPASKGNLPYVRIESASPAADYYSISSTPSPESHVFYPVSTSIAPSAASDDDLVYPSSTVPPQYAPVPAQHNYYYIRQRR